MMPRPDDPSHEVSDPDLGAVTKVSHEVLIGGWLEVTTGAPEGTARLQVSSSGAEIPGDRVAELFEPFRRGPVARTADTPGSGLGLSIVRAVVQAHGGRVWAEPVPGGGLTVTVQLPGC